MARKTVPAFSAAALAPAFAFAMRDMHVKYTGPTANLRYGNERADRAITYIKQHAQPENWKRLMFNEAKRLAKTAEEVGSTVRKSPFGPHIDTDYAAQLRQASFAVRLMAEVA